MHAFYLVHNKASQFKSRLQAVPQTLLVLHLAFVQNPCYQLDQELIRTDDSDYLRDAPFVEMHLICIGHVDQGHVTKEEFWCGLWCKPLRQ